MKHRSHHTQASAAAKAGFSERTARRLEADPEARTQRKAEPRTWRTRVNPFADVWASDIVPMIEAAPSLRPVTILNELARRYPERDWPSHRRTLERKIRIWKAENGVGTVRRVTANVKRWRDAEMAMRWTATGLLEANRTFRRLKAHKQLPVLRVRLEQHCQAEKTSAPVEDEQQAA